MFIWIALVSGSQIQVITVIWLVAAIILLLLRRTDPPRGRDYKRQLRYAQGLHMGWESGKPQKSAIAQHDRWDYSCKCLTCLRGDRDENEIKLLERSRQ